MKYLDEYVQNLNEKAKVKIPVEKGDMGLSLDEPLASYKKQIEGGKSWAELSQQLNTLAVFNKKKHPDVASKAEAKLNVLRTWVENKRKENPKFGD